MRDEENPNQYDRIPWLGLTGISGLFWATPSAPPTPPQKSASISRLNNSMAMSAQIPKLTPGFCFNETALRDFLRLSRSAVDDTISQNLNALLEPSHDRFDPTTTSSRQEGPRTRRLIASDSCQSFQHKVLFPAWQARSDVLHYCAGVATSPDPDDPDHLLREIEDAKARERVIDERLDPYSGRYFPREARTERLASLIRSERMIEDIVQQRTWQSMRERCESFQDPAFKPSEALERWRN